MGDFDGDNAVTTDDAVYLLRHVLFPDSYAILISGDIDGDNAVTTDDAVYLLRHVLFPDSSPIPAVKH